MNSKKGIPRDKNSINNCKSRIKKLKSAENREIRLQISRNEETVILNRAKIKNGKFEMKGTADSAFIAILRIDNMSGLLPYLQPIAVEQGNAYVFLGEEAYVGGTPLNEKLHLFMVAKGDFLKSGPGSSETEFRKFIHRQIESNKDCPRFHPLSGTIISNKYSPEWASPIPGSILPDSYT